ncbi:MAG: class I SAM-dependent methyltransferase [Pseudomonadota bacterium]
MDVKDAFAERQFAAGCVRLHDGPDPETDPVIAGQIASPTKSSIDYFKIAYSPLLDSVCTPGKSVKVLEIGAGVGNCTFAFLNTYQPDFYIASEPFPSLIPTLRQRLDEWGYAFPRGVAATWDANFPSILPQQAFTVIVGNSVLHHITRWREALDHSLCLLEDDGVLVFGEPNHETWAVTVSFVRALNFSDALSAGTKLRLNAYIAGLEYRFRIKDNLEALSKLEDKHIFSFRELMEFARSRGVTLSINSQTTTFQKSFLAQVMPLMTTAEDGDYLRSFAKSVISPGIDGTLLSNFFTFKMQK